MQVIIYRSGNPSRALTKSFDNMDEALIYFDYTLQTGKAYENEKGNKKINMFPRTAKSLVLNLNKAVKNSAINGNPSISYGYVEND